MYKLRLKKAYVRMSKTAVVILHGSGWLGGDQGPKDGHSEPTWFHIANATGICENGEGKSHAKAMMIAHLVNFFTDLLGMIRDESVQKIWNDYDNPVAD